MTASGPSAPVRSRDAGPLGRRDVRLLVAGQAASEPGSQVGSIALPLGGLLGAWPASKSGRLRRE